MSELDLNTRRKCETVRQINRNSARFDRFRQKIISATPKMTASSQQEIIQIATNMSNWKNVNNWHWVEKNCLEWARKWLAEQLKAIPGRDILGYSNVHVEEVSDIKGDADLNVRKGKLRYLFDLSLKLVVVATGTVDGEKVECKCSVAEFTFDETPKNFEYTYTSSEDVFRAVVEKEFSHDLWAVFEQFAGQLVEQNAGSLMVNTNESEQDLSQTVNGARHVASQKQEPAAPAEKKPESKASSLVSIEILEDFKCSPEDLFLALTDSDRIRMWSHAPCAFTLNENEPFNLFGGALSGTVVAFDKNKSLKLKWRLKAWPVNVESTVSFIIQNREDYIKLVVSQVGVPREEQESIREAWKKMYFERIKQAFGYVY